MADITHVLPGGFTLTETVATVNRVAPDGFTVQETAAAAGSAFKPAWARPASQIIGGGSR